MGHVAEVPEFMFKAPVLVFEAPGLWGDSSVACASRAQLTSLILVLVLVLCRLKRPAPRRKYGLLSNYDDSVEMVEGESDEDDTLYEARSLRRSEVTLPVSPALTGPV